MLRGKLLPWNLSFCRLIIYGRSVAVDADVDLAVLFMHNDGYSTMCGHAVLALARYAVDRRPLVSTTAAGQLTTGGGGGADVDVRVTIQCPCGPVNAFVQRRRDGSTTGRVRFHSVPAFAFALGRLV